MLCMSRRLIINHGTKPCFKSRTLTNNAKLHLSTFKLLSAVNVNLKNEIRNYSSVSNSSKKILKSSYTDVHTNLAIEDWIFKNCDEDEEILLMWKNDPCVVIGIQYTFVNPETMIMWISIFDHTSTY